MEDSRPDVFALWGTGTFAFCHRQNTPVKLDTAFDHAGQTTGVAQATVVRIRPLAVAGPVDDPKSRPVDWRDAANHSLFKNLNVRLIGLGTRAPSKRTPSRSKT
jgi:hypothetical protein